MQSKNHWENVYTTKATTAVSWFQEHAQRSLKLMQKAGVPTTADIIDVGGGASMFADDLLAQGYEKLTVLDLSGAALAATKIRLGQRATQVQWLEGDVIATTLPANTYDVWHDRAVFHFLITAEERQAYQRQVVHALKPDGWVIIATFAEDGPTQCSGLPVMRYSATELHAEFGAAFILMASEKESHSTPSGNMQQFGYCLLRRVS